MPGIAAGIVALNILPAATGQPLSQVILFLLLSVLGGSAGLLLGEEILAGILWVIPNDLSEFDIGLDVTVLGFTAAISLMTGVVFGLLPALTASRAQTALKDGGRTSSRGAAAARRLPGARRSASGDGPTRRLPAFALSVF